MLWYLPLTMRQKTEIFIFLYIEQTPVASCFNALLCHYLDVRRPQIISLDTMAVPLDSCIVGLWHPKKTPQDICL